MESSLGFENQVVLGFSWDVVPDFLATYWLHSTIFIGLVWCIHRAWRPASHFLSERTWKMAAIAGFATAGIQLLTGLGLFLGSTNRGVPNNQDTKGLVSIPAERRTTDKSPAGTPAIKDDLSRRNTDKSPEPGRKPSASKKGNRRANAQSLKKSMAMVQESFAELADALPQRKMEADDDREPSDPDMQADRDVRQQKALVTRPLVRRPRDASDAMAKKRGLGKTHESAIGLVKDSSSAMLDDAKDHDLTFFQGSRGERSRSVQHFLIVTSVAWVLGWVLYLVFRSARFHWQMSKAAVAAPSHQKLLTAICQRNGIQRAVRLLKSDRFCEPVAFGLWRWTIILPSEIEQRFNREELTALISHELAHLTRNDILWLTVGRILTTCFSFQPLNFVSRKHWQIHAEFQCDDWAVERQVDRLTLARSLTLCAELRLHRTPSSEVVSAGGPRFHLTDRVERLLEDLPPDAWRGRWRRLALNAALGVVVGCVILLGPQTGARSQERLPSQAKSRIDRPTATIDRGAAHEVRNDNQAQATATNQARANDLVRESTSVESFSSLIREVEGLTSDVAKLVAELRQLEPILAILEQQPERKAEVIRIRSRIAQLREFIKRASRGKTSPTSH